MNGEGEVDFKYDDGSLEKLVREYDDALPNLPDSVQGYEEFVRSLFRRMDSNTTTALHACVGIAGEAGELLDIVKKVWAYGKPLDRAKLLDELGDVRFYYQALCNEMDITDDVVVMANIVKLTRRYPSGTFTAQDAIAQRDKLQLEPAPAVAEDADERQSLIHDLDLFGAASINGFYIFQSSGGWSIRLPESAYQSDKRDALKACTHFPAASFDGRHLIFSDLQHAVDAYLMLR